MSREDLWTERRLAASLRDLADTPTLRAAEARTWRRLQAGATRRPSLPSLLSLPGLAAAAALASLALFVTWPRQVELRSPPVAVEPTTDDLAALGIYDVILSDDVPEEAISDLAGEATYKEVEEPSPRLAHQADPRSLDRLYEDYHAVLGPSGVVLTSY